MEMMDEPKAVTVRSHPLTPTQVEGLWWFAPFLWGPVTLYNLEHVEVGIQRQSQNQGFQEV